MKELLLKRRFRFALYLLACMIPIVDQLIINFALALMIGSIEIATVEHFTKVVLISIGSITLGSVLYIISRFMRISFMRDTLLDVREKAFDKIIKSSYKTFNMKSKDSYISNLINDINIFENNFFLKLINVIYTGGTFAVVIIILAFMDFLFAMGILFISLLLLLIIKLFEKKTVELQEEVSNSNEEFSIDISNTFNGLEILKLNNIEDKFLQKTLLKIKNLEKKKYNYTVFTEGQVRLSNLMGHLVVVSILLYLLNLHTSDMSLTRLVFMFQLSNNSVWSMVRLLPLLNELKSSVNIYNKITKSDEDMVQIPAGDKDFSFQSKIEVKDLYFSYEGKDVFRGVSFTIEKGKKYLIKGASGAGKSTLIKLLSKIYDDYQGKITVDGIDYKEINEDSLNQNVGFIYQDVFLFEDTIINNITLYKEYDEEKILKAIDAAGLKDVISKKGLGLNETILENGKNLSGGERQRISIARAIIKDSKILFVDEGTSSLNEELGRSIENTILSLDSTVIAISHRYYKGITEKYDYVLEIVNGKINKYTGEEYFQGEIAV
ncbi:ABC-type multidrug transport system, ATPase and permease component [Anaerobranca californiensis DSM 14826]|uniref:ABC-type multidrug transport system, ATPase and permease component n=1 Tax=Anaerobranca californiensis DSM 14826 TaxID=1120989 RepID=A0A1M6N7M7_9FIRM|nr:ABC transporter ATP-binding protein [Anaerobranca californiensis]SHJ91720.1 ABC-type multidrug transport system, ATPase and permease component [Anaerobranca californiensis DSM 14826]